MGINSNKILKRLEETQNDRGKATLYLSKKLLRDFKAQCGDYSVSVVIEELMKEFIASAKLKPKRSK